MADAVSANTRLEETHFTDQVRGPRNAVHTLALSPTAPPRNQPLISFHRLPYPIAQHLYRVEWVPGPDGYIRWYLDDEFMYGVGANALNKTGAVIPEEPMCVTVTIAVTIACHPSRDCAPAPALARTARTPLIPLPLWHL